MMSMGLLQYNLKLALRNIRRNPILSALMIAAIGIGIGAYMTILSINHTMGSNPIPSKSDELYYVRLDNWGAEEPFWDDRGPPPQLTYLDATALMEARRAHRQAAMSKASLAIEPNDPEQRPFFVDVRGTFADFFPMFEVPFKYGAGWPAESDEALDQVVVLSEATNERVFGGANSVGETLTMSGSNYRIVGVLDAWEPMPKFYDIHNGPFDAPEDVYIPMNLITANRLPRRGNTNCYKSPEGEGYESFLNSECIWIQFWAELPSRADRDDYMSFLDAYVLEQKELGRFPRPLDNRLDNVVQWLEDREVVQSEAQVLLGLAAIFLTVCLLNTIGLMLAKFLSKAPEIGVRRALGASRRVLFQQYLVESSLIGVAGGVLGIGLTRLGLWGIESQFADAMRIFGMDWVMAATAVVLAVVASVLTSLYPTWRACNVQPSAHLSTQ